MKLLKTENDYNSALTELERLLQNDPDPGSDDANRVEVLALLIEDFEAKNFPIGLPAPLPALRFRMEQQGLSHNDLVSYMGSRSKVSEVLSGKRPLSLSMIRALHFGLGIPASVLLHQAQEEPSEDNIQWDKFPIKEMMSRGWVKKKPRATADEIKEILKVFFCQIAPSPAMAAVYLKKDNIRSNRKMDHFALAAWRTWILIRAFKATNIKRYLLGSINMDFLRNVARFSRLSDGPLHAIKFLAENGIAVIIEPHLPKTFIDGAAMMALSGMPVIGLTIRHDRIDNFWFALLHELVHIWRHVHNPNFLFYDDLDSNSENDRKEREADEVAGEALIPRHDWDRSPAKVLRSPEAAKFLADSLGIHPAIVAGKMRRVAKNYRILSKTLGHGEVRHLFVN